MVIHNNSNLAQLELTARRLGALVDRFVFLGGCTTSLFITELLLEARPTLDVDCIVEVLSISNYYQLVDLLKERGFKEPGLKEDSTICRLECEGLLLDVVPTKKEILGFGNRWYEMALKNSIDYHFSDEIKIKHVTAIYFIATKLEAFKDRGNKDFWASTDFEDIITVVNGRPELFVEIESCEIEVREYISQQFVSFLNDKNFYMALPGHFYGPTSDTRSEIALNRIKQIALMKESP